MTRNLETTVEIDADISRVWQTLSQLEQFKHWNTATYFDKEAVLGSRQMMHVKLLGVWLAVPVKIESYNQEKGLRWQGGIPRFFTGSHYFKLQSRDTNKTLLIQGEDFQGALVPVLLPLLKKSLHSLYLGMNKDLKKYCEKT